MSEIPRPQFATIIVPVDAITAARAEAAGHSVEYVKNRVHALLSLACEPTDPLVAIASDHATPRIFGQGLTVDLTEGLLQIRDDSPPIPSDVPGPDRSPLWPEPRAELRYARGVHLPGDADVRDLRTAVLNWLQSVPKADPQRVSELHAVWRAQATQMLTHATNMAKQLPTTLTEEERQGVLNRLSTLATHVRYARDGGLDPDEPDEDLDPWGDKQLRPAHRYINDAYQAVLTACERTTDAGGDRVRSDDVHAELRTVATFFAKHLPDRFTKAKKLGLLDTTLGAARSELVGMVWPQWRYVSDGEELRQVVNPSLEALEALEVERAFDKKHRPWPHDQVTIQWLIPTKAPVLVSSFLGRTIIRQRLSDSAGAE